MSMLESCSLHHKGYSRKKRHDLCKRVPNIHFQVFDLLPSTLLTYLHDNPQDILVDLHRIFPELIDRDNQYLRYETLTIRHKEIGWRIEET